MVYQYSALALCVLQRCIFFSVWLIKWVLSRSWVLLFLFFLTAHVSLLYSRTFITTHGQNFLNHEYEVQRSVIKPMIPRVAWRLYHHWHQKKPNFFQQSATTQEKKIASKDCWVRVLLSQANECKWFLQSQDGFSIRFNDEKKSYALKSSSISLISDETALRLNNKILTASKVEMIPRYGRIIFNGIEYEGSFIIVFDKENYLLINKLPLEKYLYSVLNSESWPGWPLEVNKAFAIASRSYVLAKRLEQRAKKRAYDVKDSNVHQTYRGFHTTQLLKKAVEETKGMILTYKQQPIVAMFDCCCGGVIPAHIDGVDFDKAPYLARQIACTFCKKSKLYSWNMEIDVTELEKILHQKGVAIQRLSDITISKKDKAGVVQEVTLHASRSKKQIDGKKLYTWLKPLKSYCFSIGKKHKKICLEGRGYGHHLGMCQWGARAMVDHGFTYRQILNFYYPQTQLMKIRCA